MKLIKRLSKDSSKSSEMKNNSILFCVCLLSLAIFTALSTSERNTRTIVNQQICKIGDRISAEFKLNTIGNGARMPDNIIEALNLRFSFQGHLLGDEARKFTIKVSEKYLELVNQSEELKPYMTKYPFDYRNINLIIFFKDDSNNTCQHPYICSVSVVEEDVIIRTEDIKENKYGFKSTICEHYLEALEKVKHL